MSAPNHPASWASSFLLLVGALPLALPPAALGDESGEVVAVYASVSPAYSRTPAGGGSFKPETYAFGEGGRLGGVRRDETIDKLRFLDIARVIAPSLASKNYLPCKTTDPRQTDLLIMVYWGTTVGTDRTSSEAQYQIAEGLIPPPPPLMSLPPTGQGGTAMASDPSTSGRGSEGTALAAVKAANNSALQQSLTLMHIANGRRDQQDLDNATILGYLPEMKRVQSYEMTPSLNQRRQDVLDEVEDSRYYVVLMAYDFQALLLHQQRKLRWETRFSIRERHNDFGQQLAAMAHSASHFFGQNSNGLTRVALPAGRVEYGELKVLGFEPEKK